MPAEEDDFSVPVAPPAYEGLTLLDMLSRAQRALYATLLQRIESGSADKEDIKTLRQLLAENGLTLMKEEVERKMIDITPKPVALPDYRSERFDE